MKKKKLKGEDYYNLINGILSGYSSRPKIVAPISSGLEQAMAEYINGNRGGGLTGSAGLTNSTATGASGKGASWKFSPMTPRNIMEKDEEIRKLMKKSYCYCSNCEESKKIIKEKERRLWR